MSAEVSRFYGSATISKVKDMDMLSKAHKQFEMAIKSESPQIQERALALAAKNELAAFVA